MAGAASAAAALLLAACGGHGAAKAARRAAPGPTTTAVVADTWSPPVVAGPPSTATFCTLLVATYAHIGTLPRAASLRVRQDIVSDYVRLTPHVVAAAPPQIAEAAKLYLTTVATVLTLVNRVGLDASRLPKGQLSELLLDPRVRAAGDAVVNFSQQDCRYTIGG